MTLINCAICNIRTQTVVIVQHVLIRGLIQRIIFFFYCKLIETWTILSDSWRMAKRLSDRSPGALQWSDILRYLCFWGEAGMGWPWKPQWREMWHNWSRWTGWRNRNEQWNFCKSKENVWCYQSKQWSTEKRMEKAKASDSRHGRTEFLLLWKWQFSRFVIILEIVRFV